MEPVNEVHFVPMRRPPQGSRQNRAPRPHSIGATIISNPKLVKGWSYYDNSPNPRNIQKYFSTINLPPEPVNRVLELGPAVRKSNDDILPENESRGDTGRRSQLQEDPNEEDAMIGIEIKARVAENDEHGGCTKFARVLITLIAGSAFALASVLVRVILDEDYNPYSVSLWTLQGIFLPSLVVYMCSKVVKTATARNMSKENLRIDYILKREQYSYRRRFLTGGLIILRGILGGAALVLRFYSFNYIAVLDSTIILCTAPIFVVFIAWICFRERIGLMPFLMAVVALLGLGMITRPPFLTGKSFDRYILIGCLFAAGSMLLEALSLVILRYLYRRNVHFAIVNSTYGVVGSVGCLAMCMIRKDEFQLPEGFNDWLFAGAIAGLYFLGQNLMKNDTKGVYTAARIWEIPLTFLLIQLFFIKQFPRIDWFFENSSLWLSITGGIIVILGAALMSLRSWVSDLPAESSKVRSKLRCLLI